MNPIKIYSQYAIDKATSKSLSIEDIKDICIFEYERNCRGNYEVVYTSDAWPNYAPFLKLKILKEDAPSFNSYYVLVSYNPRVDRDFVYIWGFTNFANLLPFIKSETNRFIKLQMPAEALSDPLQLLRE